MKNIIAATNTRSQARSFINKAKKLGVQGFSQPIKAYGKWFVEVKPRPVLTLKKGG